MTILILIPFLQRGVVFVFPFSMVCKIDEVEHPCVISSHGKFLGVLSSNVWSLDILDALQRVTGVVWLARFNCYYRYRGFKAL